MSARFHVCVSGVPVLSCLEFGSANRAAMGVLPGFSVEEAGVLYRSFGEEELETEVRTSEGLVCAHYAVSVTGAHKAIGLPLSEPMQPRMPAEHERIHWIF